MPRNTGIDLIASAIMTQTCFALIWHIWWLVGVTFVASIACFIVRSYDEDTDYYVQPGAIARIEAARSA